MSTILLKLWESVGLRCCHIFYLYFKFFLFSGQVTVNVLQACLVIFLIVVRLEDSTKRVTDRALIVESKQVRSYNLDTAHLVLGKSYYSFVCSGLFFKLKSELVERWHMEGGPCGGGGLA